MFYLALVLLVVTVLSVQGLAVMQLQNMVYRNSGRTPIAVNTLLNYGNGMSRWANRSDVNPGSNFYELTVSVASTETTPSSIANQHFITGLDNVRAAGRYYWTLWVYCIKDTAWTASRVGADLILLANGDTLAWYYQAPPSPNPRTWQPPVDGARMVEECST